MLSTTVCLCALAAWAVAKTTRQVMSRLGLDPMSALLWFGLAEWPTEPRVGRRRSLGQGARERAARRRSPHRRAIPSKSRQRMTVRRR